MKKWILLALILSGCAVTVPDVPLCVEISPSRGHCIYTLSAREYTIDDEHPHEGKTWWDMRPAMILAPAESWAKIKKFIIEVCRKTKKCDTEMGSWDRTVEAIDKMVAK